MLAGNATFGRAGRMPEEAESVPISVAERHPFRHDPVGLDPASGSSANNRVPSRQSAAILYNSGIVSIPRGFSLTIDGGIEQLRTGIALVDLPPPLYLQNAGGSPVSEVTSVSFRSDETEPISRVYPLVVRSGVVKLAGAVNASIVAHADDAERLVFECN